MEKLLSIEEVIKKYTSEQALAMVLQDVLIKDRQNTRDTLLDEIDQLRESYLNKSEITWEEMKHRQETINDIKTLVTNLFEVTNSHN